MPPPRGSRPFGASPARARPLAAPHPGAPRDPRPARPARPPTGRDARPAARGPNRGPAHSAALAARPRRCLWPPVASRAPPGTDTLRAPPLHWNRGTSDDGGSPGSLVRVGLLLLHRLVGLGAHPHAGMRNGDHEAFAHPERARGLRTITLKRSSGSKK